MKRITNHVSLVGTLVGLVMWCATVTNLHAQIVTNGGFESSSTGTVDTTAVKGWVIQVASGITPPPVFEIVSDTVEQGSRALKVTVHGLGTNQWDIQVVADSIAVKPGTTYNYSIWAKSDKPGATVNFTMGNYSFTEYGAIRPATLSTQWQKFTMQFTVNDGQTYIRGPIHFYGAVDTGNSIYIDNLQIVDPNVGKKPVIVEAESGQLGSYFNVLQDGGVTYVGTDSNWTSLTAPGDTTRMITYQVHFADSGSYNLFARVRVGSGGFNDDSFFYGNGFGQKNDTAAGDWIFTNGLASAGFTDSSAYVDGPGTAGNSVWKWVNLTKNQYQGAKGDSFVVSPDSLTRTFQIGSRENGLDIDKIAFGKSYLYYTVHALDSVLAGTPTMVIQNPIDSSKIWKGPALAAGAPKFLGSAGDAPASNFANYWTQLTPENAGKWGSVGTSTDTTQWNWTGLDNDYNYAKGHGLVFKDHNLIWGNQQPSWISGLDSAAQYGYIETWIRMVGSRYPDMDLIDVVNEPLYGHNPPDGNNGHANYENALGGTGATGWDWLIRAFELARQYIPQAKLLINDYGILNSNANTTSYIQIINLLKDRGLIDGIGCQAHGLESTSAATVQSNLDRLAATGLPIYISEFDLNIQDDTQQKTKYQELFPVMWQHPGVKGVTLWGYIQGRTWLTNSYLVNTDGTARPALLWLADYIKNNPLGVDKTVSVIPKNFALEQNFPNPFNPTTNIRYSIPTTSKVTLKVFDILGQQVETLVNETQVPGQYTVTLNGQNLATGVYFYRFTAGSYTATKKLMLIK